MLTNIFVALTALLIASPVLAAAPHKEPHHEPGKHVTKRNRAGVYICIGQNWSGNCYWEEAAIGYCHEYWLGPNTSFGPDEGLRCTVHPQSNCQGDNYISTYPGTKALAFTGLSWMCQEE